MNLARINVARIIAPLLFLVCVAMPTVRGDRVWLQPPAPTSTQGDWYPRAIQKLSGDVVAFDDKQLRIRVSGDEAETVIAASRVLWIEPENVSELEGEAIASFTGGKYSEALVKLPEILKQRPPVWRQQWITMLASVAAWKSARGKIALELVSQLDRRGLPPVAIAWLPVAWNNRVQGADAIEAARERIDDPSAAVRLVAASWLLSSPDRTQATATLKKLRGDQRNDIARLADVLLWRTATPPQVVELAAKWQARLDQLPMVLQVGPTRTLIDKLRTAGKGKRADHLEWSLELSPIHPHYTSIDAAASR